MKKLPLKRIEVSKKLGGSRELSIRGASARAYESWQHLTTKTNLNLFDGGQLLNVLEAMYEQGVRDGMGRAREALLAAMDEKVPAPKLPSARGRIYR